MNLANLISRLGRSSRSVLRKLHRASACVLESLENRQLLTQTVYFNDFENGSSLAGLSGATSDAVPSTAPDEDYRGNGFIRGPVGGSVSLTLRNLKTHYALHVSADLFLLGDRDPHSGYNTPMPSICGSGGPDFMISGGQEDLLGFSYLTDAGVPYADHRWSGTDARYGVASNNSRWPLITFPEGRSIGSPGVGGLAAEATNALGYNAVGEPWTDVNAPGITTGNYGPWPHENAIAPVSFSFAHHGPSVTITFAATSPGKWGLDNIRIDILRAASYCCGGTSDGEAGVDAQGLPVSGWGTDLVRDEDADLSPGWGSSGWWSMGSPAIFEVGPHQSPDWLGHDSFVVYDGKSGKPRIFDSMESAVAYTVDGAGSQSNNAINRTESGFGRTLGVDSSFSADVAYGLADAWNSESNPAHTLMDAEVVDGDLQLLSSQTSAFPVEIKAMASNNRETQYLSLVDFSKTEAGNGVMHFQAFHVEIGDRFRLAEYGPGQMGLLQTVSYTAESTSAADVAQGLLNAWEALGGDPLEVLTASVQDDELLLTTVQPYGNYGVDTRPSFSPYTINGGGDDSQTFTYTSLTSAGTGLTQEDTFAAENADLGDTFALKVRSYRGSPDDQSIFYHDLASGQYVLVDPDGTQVRFADSSPGGGNRYAFVSSTDGSGNVWKPDPSDPSYDLFYYYADDLNTPRKAIQWAGTAHETQVLWGEDDSGWFRTSQAEHEFSADGMKVTTSVWNGSSWDTTGESYYRYYGTLISGITHSGEDGKTATATLSSQNPYHGGDKVIISNASRSAYNGTFIVTGVTDNTITYQMESNPGSDVTASAQEVLQAVEADGYFGGVKYVIGAEAFATLEYLHGGNTGLWTDDELAPYADTIYQYDNATHRVTAEGSAAGGLSSITRAISSNNDGMDAWTYKTVTTQPDGNQVIDYRNYLGYTILSVTRDLLAAQSISSITWASTVATVTTSASHGYSVNDVVIITGATPAAYNGTFVITGVGSNTFTYTLTSDPAGSASAATVQKVSQQRGTFTKYDEKGHAVLTADSSAVVLPAILDTLEVNPDLLHADGNGHYEYLADSAGLIHLTQYYETTTATADTPGGVAGYLYQELVEQGDTGTPVLLSSIHYKAHAGSDTWVYPVADQTQYPNADGTGARTTRYLYGFEGDDTETLTDDTTKMTWRKTILPPIAAGQNGPASGPTDFDHADARVEVFDSAGRVKWTMDGVGRINYTEYDEVFGAVVKTITDVDTSQTSDFDGDVPVAPTVSDDDPTTWQTPTGGGLHLVTTMGLDGQGRAKQIKDPNENAAQDGNITYTVYKDAAHEVHVYPAWHSIGAGQYAATGPIQISRENRAAGYSESLTVSSTLNMAVPDGSETIDLSTILSLSRSYTNAAGQVSKTDRYYSFSGMPSLPTGDPDPTDTQPLSTANYYRTLYGYDSMGRQIRVVRPTGTVVSPTGALPNPTAVTITRTVYDADGRVSSTWVGTTDTPTGGNWSDWSPTNTTGTDLVKVSENRYDSIGNLVLSIQYTTANASPTQAHATQMWYDWQGRLVATKLGAELDSSGNLAPAGESTSDNRSLTYSDYDNLGEVIASYQYDADAVNLSIANGVPAKPDAGKLRAKTTNEYDDQGRVFASHQFSVDPGTGAVSSGSLNSYTWYDHGGRVIKTAQPGGLVSKYQYDGAGRVVKTFASDANDDVKTTSTLTHSGTTATATTTSSHGYQTGDWVYISGATPSQYNGSFSITVVSDTQFTYAMASDPGADAGGTVQVTAWTSAQDVLGDIVLSQQEAIYDANGNVIFAIDRERFHDDTTNTGELGDPASTGLVAKARVSYAESFYDAGNRLLASVNLGSNGGTVLTERPDSSVPTRSDTKLVTSYTYNTAGLVDSVTDPRGIVGRTYYDAAGRQTSVIEAYTGGTPTDSTDRRTEYMEYDGNDHVLWMRAVLPDDAYQDTAYTYGVTRDTNSEINTNDLLATISYPDKDTGAASSNGSDQQTFTYNTLGQTVTKTDQNGTVHTYSYDLLGRLTFDAVTLGTGNPQPVTDAVLRLGYTYDSAGRTWQFTSYDATSGGTVVNQVERHYNGLGQLVAEYQSHSGAVDTDTTPEVQYTYSDLAHGSRLSGVVYPNGRILRYEYGSSGSLNDRVGRLAFLADDASGSVGTHLEEYQYLGLSTIVSRNHPEAGLDLTYVSTTNSTGDAGDQYTGLDRFGRVVDQLWTDTNPCLTSGADHYRYGYDANGNVLYKDNALNATDSELYHDNGGSAGYDDLNRLTDFKRGVLSDSNSDGVPDTVEQPLGVEDWTLDPLGNWNEVSTTDGETTNTENRTHNAQNQITGSDTGRYLCYDNNGNLTAEYGPCYNSYHPCYTFGYDAWNHMASANDLTTGGRSYAYDALGRKLNDSDGYELYYSQNWQVLEERQEGQVTDQYVWSPVYVDAMVERDQLSQVADEDMLDQGFGQNGVVTTVQGTYSMATSVALQPDGKLLVAGLTGSGIGAFALCRYEIDGSLDEDFGSGGIVTGTFGGDGFGAKIALQGDGKILLLGGYDHFVISRFNSDGTVDTGFGVDGTQSVDMSTWVSPASVAVDGDGRIVMVGTSGPSGYFTAACLDSSGDLDSSFGDGGVAVVPSFFPDVFAVAQAVAIQSDDKIVLGGYTGNSEDTSYAVARLNTDGSLDDSFGTDGQVTITLGSAHDPCDLALDSLGRIVLAGNIVEDSQKFVVVRFASDGSVDETFGDSGHATVAFDGTYWAVARAVAIGENDSIIVGGYADVAEDGQFRFAVARLNSDGSLDNSFSGDGRDCMAGLGGSTGWAVAVQGDGKIVLAGYTDSTNPTSFAVARYLATSAIDQRLYVMQDANWNVTGLADLSGTVVQRYIEGPYGTFTVLNPTWLPQSDQYNWLYVHQGGRYDSYTGKVNFRNREYDPDLGRWISEDPMGYVDGMSVYQNEGSTPCTRSDPTGTDSAEPPPIPVFRVARPYGSTQPVFPTTQPTITMTPIAETSVAVSQAQTKGGMDASSIIQWGIGAQVTGQIVQHVTRQAWIWKLDGTHDVALERAFSGELWEAWNVVRGKIGVLGDDRNIYFGKKGIFTTAVGEKGEPIQNEYTFARPVDQDIFSIKNIPECTYGYMIVRGRAKFADDPLYVSGDHVPEWAGLIPARTLQPEGWSDAGTVEHYLEYRWYSNTAAPGREYFSMYASPHT